MTMICRVCGRETTLPTGDPKSVLGILLERPFFSESPESGGWKQKSRLTSREILARELERVGINLSRCRVASVWGHAVSADDKDFSYNLTEAIRAVKKCRAVLLLGELSSEIFLNKKVADISGLRVMSDLLPMPLYAAKSPSELFYGTLGEFRLALEQLSKSKEIKSWLAK